MKFHSFKVVSDIGVIANVCNDVWVNVNGSNRSIQIVSTFQGMQRPASLVYMVYVYSGEADYSTADINEQRPSDLFELGKILV